MSHFLREPMAILVVEDDPGDFGLVKTYLRQAGLTPGGNAGTVAWAKTLADGVAAARRTAPDIVLLDLSLPDSAGLATVQAMRAALPEALIVVLTGSDENALAIAALESGAQDYLVKGRFDHDALGRAVRHARVRGQLEQGLARSNRLYSALSQCNQAIVRCTGEDELLLQACRIAVDLAGMKMAWVGMVDETTRLVHPRTSFGAGADYLHGIEISAAADSPFGGGPSGIAIRENRPVWCQDFIHDPLTAPWHEDGARFGWRAMASLPLHRDNAVIGVFSLYAGEVDAFDEAARGLLLEMSIDIGFALDNFLREVERRRVQAVILRERDFSQAALDSLPGLFYLIDAQGRFLRWNQNLEKISGYRADEISAMSPLDFFGENDSAPIAEAIRQVYEQGEVFIEAEFLAKDRTRTPYLFTGKRWPYDGIPCMMGMGIDITPLRKANERIQWLSHFDPLTGLANQSLLGDRFSHALSMAQRDNRALTLIVLDLDHFKHINDTLGRHIGDALLVEVARRIQSVMREEDTVSRQGGDEFILLMPTTDVSGAAHAAERLLEVIGTNYQIEAHELMVTPSIGIAMYPTDGTDFESLSKNADVAMYRAKEDGRNCYRFFAVEMQTRSTRTLQLESALRHALERNQMALHYQPQISLRDGRMVGAEALLRWRHPEFGMVSPEEFIPIAEASGQILQLGEWVLRTAARQVKAWVDAGLYAAGDATTENPQSAPMVMAVNLSVVQFRHPRMTEQVMRILAEEGLAPGYLELELTEGVALGDPVGAIAVMNTLHANGVRMSIDDFGTGYSSLSYLKRFKVCKLKIDQSFVRDISVDPEDKAIVSAIIGMAGRLGLRTIAEGVETEGQLAFLRESGCDEAQGNYFSEPLATDAFAAFLRSASAAGAAS